MHRTHQGQSFPPVPAVRFPANSAVSPYAYPDEDWRNVTDLAERRRIQNRIAQRNYRQKKKEKLEKERLDGAEKRAPSISPERSRLKSTSSLDGEAALSRPSPRPKSAGKDKSIRPNRSPMATPLSSRRPSPLEDGAAFQSAAYSTRLPDNSFFTTSASSSYVGPAISAPFSSPPMTYTDLSHYPITPGYSPSHSLPSTSTPPLPPQYHCMTTEPHVPFGGGLTSYATSSTGSESHYSRSNTYPGLTPRLYPYGYDSDSLSPRDYRDTDPELEGSHSPPFQ